MFFGCFFFWLQYHQGGLIVPRKSKLFLLSSNCCRLEPCSPPLHTTPSLKYSVNQSFPGCTDILVILAHVNE